MSLADDMRVLAEKGKRRNTKEQAAEERRKQAEREVKIARAEVYARETLMPKVKAAIHHAANGGQNSISYFVGEIDGDGITSLHAGTIKTLLVEEGFKVNFRSLEQKSFGSDPGRWDIYTTLGLEIQWS
jgi:hypothetical protein